MANNRNSFQFQFSWEVYLSVMTPEDCCAIFAAAIDYARDGVEPSLSPRLKKVFQQIKCDIDRESAISNHRREAACKRYAKRRKAAKDDTMVCNPQQVSELGHKNASETLQTAAKEKEREKEKFLPPAPPSIKEKDKEKEKLSHSARVRKHEGIFTPPTLAEVNGYAKEKGLSINGECFLSYHQSRGWIVGNSPMLDWKAAVLTWAFREKQSGRPAAADPTTPGLGVGEYFNAKGQRTYSYSGVIVPQDAPPRPSEAHWWGEISNRWENMI